MSTATEEIEIPNFRTRAGLREEAIYLRERSKQLRADSQRLRVANSVIVHDILAIAVRVNEIIYNLDDLTACHQKS